MLIFEPMPWSRWVSFGWPVWISLLAIGLFSLTLATVLFFAVLQNLQVNQAILSVYLSTVFGVVIAAIAVHEKIRAELIAGGALVFVSTFLVTYCEQRPKTSRRRLHPAAGEGE
jgi:drug/metabolite transporter (DMT)-like permease